MGLIRYRALLATSTAVAIGGAIALTTVTPALAATGCRVTYAVTSQWSSGFGASVKIDNLGSPITSWRLTWSFTAGQVVTTLWNGTVSQSGAQLTVNNASWNGSIGTGASTVLGFNGTWNNSSNPAPTNFALNGAVCTGSVTTTGPTTAGPPTTGPTTRPPTTAPTTQPPTSVSDQVNVAGRVKPSANALQYTWPGVYLEGRFRGTGVGIVLNDPNNDYDVRVDATTVATLVTPGQITYWVNNLSNAEHTVRIVKRSESPWGIGEFGGLVAAPGGAILTKPTAKSRQIEFIGDSFTAGYGNMSSTRDCSGNGGVNRNTNADLSFGALSARTLNAEYQINGQSGLGMVRNYAGSNPGTNFRTYDDRALQNIDGDVWRNPGTWRPQLVVIGLGINDFSTALNSNEPWPTMDSLIAAYRSAYLDFIAKIRSSYGANTVIVVSATLLSNTTVFAQTAQQIVASRNSQGDNRVFYWYYDDPNLDRLGCDWHPSVHDDQIISGQLNGLIATLPLNW